jgi:hypothetical protein
MTLSTVKNLILTSLDCDTIRQKMDQAPKQQSKKNIQKAMQKTSKGMGRYTRKITWTLLHREDSDFRTIDKWASRRKRIHKSTSFQKIFNSQVSNYIFWFMLCM